MNLADRIEDRSACIGVIALGYVGLPLIRVFWDAGFRVLGYDIDQEKIDKLQRGENYLQHLGRDFVSEMAGSDRFEATSDATRLGEPDALLVCVPTPLGEHQDPDLSFVEQTADDIAAALRPGQLVVLESTTYPGTTRQLMLPRLEGRGLSCGSDFFLAYSPEREDPGRKDTTTRSIPKLVGGVDARTPEIPLLGDLDAMDRPGIRRQRVPDLERVEQAHRALCQGERAGVAARRSTTSRSSCPFGHVNVTTSRRRSSEMSSRSTDPIIRFRRVWSNP